MTLFPRRQPTVVVDAGVEDAGTLEDLHADIFSRSWSADEFTSLLESKGVFGLLARPARLAGKNRAEGFILVRNIEGEAEILTLGVSSRHRRRGNGRVLIEAALRRLYENGCESVFLEVDGGNDPAITLYESQGFKSVGERRGYFRKADGKTVSALVMQCKLR